MALQSLLALLKNLVIFSSYVSEKSSFPQPLSKEKEKEYMVFSLEMFIAKWEKIILINGKFHFGVLGVITKKRKNCCMKIDWENYL